MSSVWTQKLSALQPGTQNSIVIGIIINSANPRVFEPSSSKFNEVRRAVWTFTLRDSPDDFINVTVWGRSDYVDSQFNKFPIGSIVEVISGKVSNRRVDDPNDAFVPTVTSSLNITVNEGTALIQNHDSDDRDRFEPLLKLPTKSIDSLRSLKFALEHIEELKDQFIDLLVVVTFIGEVRDIISRDGRKFKCRSFEVTDHSTNKSVALQLWDSEWIRLSELWEPRRTVLILADIRVGFDKFKKRISMSIAKKTLITENPNIPQTNDLRLAVTNKPEFTHTDPYSIPNLKCINSVMTVQQITQKLNSPATESNERIQFFVVLNAQVTEMNLDSKDENLLSTKCALCKKFVQKDQESCMNLECPSGNGSRKPYNLISLNVKFNLKDDTGYLIGCRFLGSAVEQFLGCTAAEFQAMNQEQRTELKWQFLSLKFAVRMQILGPTLSINQAIYNILSMTQLQESVDSFFDSVVDQLP
ncbi:protein hold'em-like [Leptopilina heterotoma]|uniref:protein hold'em-like n=1 Tax=Leptopilina heterotoma TaxID=63436 RepID=UPI001CA9BA08|nr:protein hold'em-like [Leptopilina heterotoma]